MNILLRSMFLDSQDDLPDLAFGNYLMFDQSGLGFDVPEDVTLWSFLKDFCRTHNHCPNLITLREHYTRIGEDVVVDRLEQLIVFSPIFKGDFEGRLNNRAHERKVRFVREVLREADTIIRSGLEVKDANGRETVKLLGPIDAVRYVLDKSHDIVAPTLGTRLSGEVTGDGEDFLEEYTRRKLDPLSGIGQFTGLTQIDITLAGSKKFELWTHAAFTGGLKSTFMLNWMYNQAVHYGHGCLAFSIEMPYEQCRRILYAMHSLHERFEEIRIKLGIQQQKGVEIGLEYKKIRDGVLSPNEEIFLNEYVVPDLMGKTSVNPRSSDPQGGYGNIHIEVADPDKSDFTMEDIRSKAELMYSKDPFKAIFIDHMGLLSSRRNHRSTTERLNEVVRDAKRMAMSFNRGQGIGVVGLFQISREGFKSAEKNGGNYNLTHLSYANECMPGNCLIASSRGLIRLDTMEVGDKVWSRSGWKPVQEVFDQGVRPTWKVTTDRGAEVIATGSHRVRVLKNEALEWCRVEDLHEGSWVVSTQGDYPWPAKAPSLPPLTFQKYEKPQGEQGTPLITPTCLTRDLAYLLGAWDGDGKVHPKGVAFTGNRKERSVRAAICSRFLAVFGHPIGIYEAPSRSGSFDLLKWSQPLKRWFEQVAGSRGVEVPNVIMQAPGPQMLSYLKGLFDTDGWINNQHVVGLKMKSENMLRQVQQALTMLGYDTHLTMTPTTLKKTGKTYEGWTLRLRGAESRAKFAVEIGFTEPWKMQRLLDSLGTPRKSKVKYPVGKIFVELCEAYTPHSLCTAGVLRRSHFNTLAKARRSHLVSRGSLEYLIEFLDGKGTLDSRLEILKEILDLQVTRVVSCQPTGKIEQVWDIEVTGDHEYQSGAFLSHNCERSSDIVTTSYVDDDLRKQNRVRFQCLKARDDAPFEPFHARVEWGCRRLLTTFDVDMIDTQKEEVGDAIDQRQLDEQLES